MSEGGARVGVTLRDGLRRERMPLFATQGLELGSAGRSAWKRLATRVSAPDRAVYQERRRGFLAAHVDLDRATGLELGAFDLPTVPPEIGDCAIGDVRTEIQLAQRFGHESDAICFVDYVYDPDRPLPDQLGRRFDYVILCHVLEHVPNVIALLKGLRDVLVEGGVLFLALPDKRATPDASRASTTLARLIERDLEGAERPSFSEIADFALAWRADARADHLTSVRGFYEAISQELSTGDPDVHCNVWRDEEFFGQIRDLVRGGYLPGLELAGIHPTEEPFNEFFVALVRTRLDADEEATSAATFGASDGEAAPLRSCPLCGHARFVSSDDAAPESPSSEAAPDRAVGRHPVRCSSCGLALENPVAASGDGGLVVRSDAEGGVASGLSSEQIADIVDFDRVRATNRLAIASSGPLDGWAPLADDHGWALVEAPRSAGRDLDDEPDPGDPSERGRAEAARGVPDPVDLVVLHDTLNRELDPLGVLLSARDSLRRDGLLVIQVPGPAPGSREAIAAGRAVRDVGSCRLTLGVLGPVLAKLGLATERLVQRFVCAGRSRE